MQCVPLSVSTECEGLIDDAYRKKMDLELLLKHFNVCGTNIGLKMYKERDMLVPPSELKAAHVPLHHL